MTTFTTRADLEAWLSKQHSLIRAFMDLGEAHEVEEARAELEAVEAAHGHLRAHNNRIERP